jgi:hypothetical protein
MTAGCWPRLAARQKRAEAALAIFNNRTIEIMLIDYNMPKKSRADARSRITGTAAGHDHVGYKCPKRTGASARDIKVKFINKSVSGEALRGFVSSAMY